MTGELFLEGHLRYIPLAHEDRLCALRDAFDRDVGKPGEAKFVTLTVKDVGPLERPGPREPETPETPSGP